PRPRRRPRRPGDGPAARRLARRPAPGRAAARDRVATHHPVRAHGRGRQAVTARVHMTVLAAVATLLASLSLSSVFKDGQWFWQVVSAIAVASAGCALGRRMGLPRLLVPVIGLAALVLLLTWVYARDVAVLGILPGPGALRALAQLAQDGADATRQYAAPAP